MLEQFHNKGQVFKGQQSHSPQEFKSIQKSSNLVEEEIKKYQLEVASKNGMIFSSSTIPISGTAKFPTNKTSSYSILIYDENSMEITRMGLTSEMSDTVFQSSFTWDLKSRDGSYAVSGRYRISLVEAYNVEEFERCYVDCLVADTRAILATTNLLKSSCRFADPMFKRIVSIYADIIKEIEIRIIKGLEEGRFDEPYFVAQTTTGFIQQIYSDIENKSASKFRPLVEEFLSRNPRLRLQENSHWLGLRVLFDFLVNYMADPEDHARAMAMIKCEYRNFTSNDRSVILSALVSGILPHCITLTPAHNVISKTVHGIAERLLRIGISYICAKHIDKSISICKATLE